MGAARSAQDMTDESEKPTARDESGKSGSLSNSLERNRSQSGLTAEGLNGTAVWHGIDLSPSNFPEPTVISAPEPPRATHWGTLNVGDAEIPCYVLRNGVRVFNLKGVVASLIGTSWGPLGEYLQVKALHPYLPEDFIPDRKGAIPALFKFDTGSEGIGKYALGVNVEKFMDLCGAYSAALQDHASGQSEVRLTERQMEIAIRANLFLRVSAKTGIIALVDEATGYQFDRSIDALQLELKLFREDEMRKWEKTFPDQLWVEFGRLTKWKGTLHQRPKYWGKLVMELVYGYLDPDVAKWLKKNTPQLIGGQNYHRWITEQYGLKMLMEHLWTVVGMAAACENMGELRRRMAERFGRIPLQLTMYLPREDTDSK
jgi:hypothetical protein